MTTAPRETPFLVGHETSEAVFRRGLESGRLPHGWLLRGDEGVGKATLAYRLARLLLAAVPDRERCHEPTHALFRSVAHGSHPDLHVLERRVNPPICWARPMPMIALGRYDPNETSSNTSANTRSATYIIGIASAARAPSPPAASMPK